MQNFQGMIFNWIQTYRENFKSALVYLSRIIIKIYIEKFFNRKLLSINLTSSSLFLMISKDLQPLKSFN